jgi:hypothetical protein
MSATGILCLCWMSFDQVYVSPFFQLNIIFDIFLFVAKVIEMLNLLYCYGQAIEFFAFLELR